MTERWCATCGRYREPHDHDQTALFDTPADRRPIDAPTAFVGRNHPDTAQAMQRRALPRSGTVRAQIVAIMREAGGEGLTDYELAAVMRRSHQSVSGATSKLRQDGWLGVTGRTRDNEFGNPSGVWVYVPEDDAR